MRRSPTAGGARPAARSRACDRRTDEPAAQLPLGQLTDEIGPERVIGLPVGEVHGLAYDSRLVEPGTLFFAIPGDHVDGHDYVLEAVANGALAVVVEHELSGLQVPQLVVLALATPTRPMPGTAIRRGACT